MTNKHINVTTATEKFIDYCKANNRNSYDWDSAWRKWIRDERSLTDMDIFNFTDQERFQMVSNKTFAIEDVVDEIVEWIQSVEDGEYSLELAREAFPQYSEDVFKHAMRQAVKFCDDLIEFQKLLANKDKE